MVVILFIKAGWRLASRIISTEIVGAFVTFVILMMAGVGCAAGADDAHPTGGDLAARTERFCTWLVSQPGVEISKEQCIADFERLSPGSRDAALKIREREVGK